MIRMGAFKTIILTLLTVSLTWATAYAPAYAKDKREKVIDFEDEVVEGMNKKPLDSLSHISEAEKRRRKPHLYRKRSGFGTEVTETLRAVRYTP